MSYNFEIPNNFYHADYRADVQVHSRKGKTKNKHNSAKLNRKIVQYKLKNMIGSNQWISLYDVHKSKSDKKRVHIISENLRQKGNDYKTFVTNNESCLFNSSNLPDLNNSTSSENIGDNISEITDWDCDWDWDDRCDDYERYSRSYSDLSDYDDFCFSPSRFEDSSLKSFMTLRSCITRT